jgi:DNA-binding MarR family transcriptional regulator
VKTDHIISLISKIRSKANKVIARELSERNIRGLSPSHGDILFYLFQNGSSSMTELAQKIDRDKSTVTALVKKLITLGYVQAVRDRRDSRVAVVSLTENGWHLKPDFDEISRILIDRVYGEFTPGEREVIVGWLEKLFQNM